MRRQTQLRSTQQSTECSHQPMYLQHCCAKNQGRNLCSRTVHDYLIAQNIGRSHSRCSPTKQCCRLIASTCLQGSRCSPSAGLILPHPHTCLRHSQCTPSDLQLTDTSPVHSRCTRFERSSAALCPQDTARKPSQRRCHHHTDPPHTIYSR